MNKPQDTFWLDAIVDDLEIPAWKRLDIAVRKWAILSQFEKEQSDYQKRKELYE